MSSTSIPPLAKSCSRSNHHRRMLMTAAVHMDSAARGLGPSASPTPAWLPVLAEDNNRHHQLLRYFAASPTPATDATAAPPNHHHRPARRVAKRRPRPSRKQPTTYITADPASFRRMVHQVTGADDLPVMPHLPAPPETLCRPAPYRSGTASASAMMLPTLDTSAFLLGAPGVAARTDAPCAAAPAVLEAAPALDRTEGAGSCNYSSNSGSSCGGGFPTLDSWDALL